jgi:hypothetical protein
MQNTPKNLLIIGILVMDLSIKIVIPRERAGDDLES